MGLTGVVGRTVLGLDAPVLDAVLALGRDTLPVPLVRSCVPEVLSPEVFLVLSRELLKL